MNNLEVHLDRVSVDYGTVRVLHELSLTVAGHEHFAVLGDNGAGKTTLLRLLVGELWPSQRDGGSRVYRLFGEDSVSPIGVRPHVRVVTPSMADWYHRHDMRIPIWEVICAGLGNTPFLYHEPTPEQRDLARNLGKDMGLGLVLDRPISAVSTGQAKRALLARALIAEPRLLAVDELTQGLDRQGQWKLLDALNRIAATGRTRLVVSGHGVLPVPEEVRGRIYLEHGRLVDDPVSGRPGPLVLPARQTRPLDAQTVLRLTSCTVVMNGVRALDNVSWDVPAGQRWAVMGANGAGKSTLLQLITGYRRPWPGGEVEWFGRTGSGDLGAVRNRIGILAPWIGERIDPDALCRDVILSGLCAGLGVHRGLSREDIQRMEAFADAWGMAGWLEKPLNSLSYGQTRQVMLARSVIHGPELLVLDEPFSGLDSAWQERMAALLMDWAAQGRTLILATHSPEFMDRLLTHALIVEDGKPLIKGTWTVVQASRYFADLFSGQPEGAE